MRNATNSDSSSNFFDDIGCSIVLERKDNSLTINKWEQSVTIILTQEQIESLIQQKTNDNKEVERKFIVDWNKAITFFDFSSLEQKHINQHYLFLWNKKEVRVRSKNGGDTTTYEFTVKIWSGETRWEYNILLSAEQYNALLALWESSLIKDRYQTIGKGHTLEFDVYWEKLAWLHALEVEFANEDLSQAYLIPPYVTKEVTQDKRFSNANLSTQSLHELFRADELAEILSIPYVEPDVGIDNIVARAKSQYKKWSPVVIRIAGGSASWKTSKVADKIAEWLPWSCIISLDDYSLWNTFIATQEKLGNSISYDEPGYVDLEQAQSDITKLQSGQIIEKPTFDFQTGEPGDGERVEPSDYIIVEGLFALHDTINIQNSISTFVDASTHGRALRRLLRDIQRTPMTAHEILEYFFRVVEPMHTAHVQSTLSNADIIINNDYNASTESLKAPNREKQTKIKIPTDTNIIRLLEKIWAKHISRTGQYDRYFETMDDQGHSHEIVRLRKTWDGYHFSYKWPLLDNGYKHTYDCETDESLLELLKQSYTWEALTVHKYRDLYEINGHIFCIDTNIRINNNNPLDEMLLEIRDADSDLQKTILSLLEKAEIEYTLLPQMSYVKYAKKYSNT